MNIIFAGFVCKFLAINFLILLLLLLPPHAIFRLLNLQLKFLYCSFYLSLKFLIDVLSSEQKLFYMYDCVSHF